MQKPRLWLTPRPVLSFILILLATSVASAETLTGRASVIDADTLDIHGERIRI